MKLKGSIVKLKLKIRGLLMRYGHAIDLSSEHTNSHSQITKRNEENQQLRTAMQAAALEASNETHLNNKRIQHLERKVNNIAKA